MPSRSSSRSRSVSIFCVTSGTLRRRSLNRFVPPLRKKRMSGFHLPPITSSVVLIGQSDSSILVSFSILHHFFLPTCGKYTGRLCSDYGGSPGRRGRTRMIVEVIRYQIAEGQEAAFEDAYRQAQQYLTDSPH